MYGMKDSYRINEKDFIICLISGGGSALMPMPAKGLTLEEKQEVTSLLLECGADIHEINTVRKHLSGVKGGRLSEHFQPATVISIIISDVVGDDLDVIASGPTVPDKTTAKDALTVLDKYSLQGRVPAAVISYLDNIVSNHNDDMVKATETPSSRFNFLIGTNRVALAAMSKKATGLGYKAVILTGSLTGETNDAAKWLAPSDAPGEDVPDAFILGGETTPVIQEDHGVGGRNQQFAVVFMDEMERAKVPGTWVLASVGTDGSDYLPDVAGAIVDDSSFKHAGELGLDLAGAIRMHDSNSFFKALGGALVETGPTGTNVGDVIVFLR
jgi:glycerate-2-kinase